MATQGLGIQVDSEFGFPHLTFTVDATEDPPSNEAIYEMFANLPADQVNLLRQTQALFPVGQQMMADILNVIRYGSNPEASAIEICGMTLDCMEFLAEHGETFIGEHIPHEVLKAQRECFVNSSTICSNNANLTYVEGLAIPPIGRLMHHAWTTNGKLALYDSKKIYKRALDYTWVRADYGRYFGMQIPLEVHTKLQSIAPEWNGGFLHHTVWCKEIKSALEQVVKAKVAEYALEP